MNKLNYINQLENLKNHYEVCGRDECRYCDLAIQTIQIYLSYLEDDEYGTKNNSLEDEKRIRENMDIDDLVDYTGDF